MMEKIKEKKEEGKLEESMIEMLGDLLREARGSPLHEMVELYEKISDSDKKTLLLRRLDATIMKKEQWIADIQYKIETLKMIKTMIEKA
jgi:hypothetical protein